MSSTSTSSTVSRPTLILPPRLIDYFGVVGLDETGLKQLLHPPDGLVVSLLPAAFPFTSFVSVAFLANTQALLPRK